MPEFEPRYGPRAVQRIAALTASYVLGMGVMVAAFVAAVTLGGSKDIGALPWILGGFGFFIPAALLAAVTLHNSAHSELEARAIRTALADGHTWSEIGAASGLGAERARYRLRTWANEKKRCHRKGIAGGMDGRIDAYEYAVLLAYLDNGDDERPKTPAYIGPLPPPGEPDPRWESLRFLYL